jgi:hypothetical protein
MSILSQFKQSQNTDFPNVRPSLDLRFALAKELDPRITFTRGSTGTYFGSDGIMRIAGVNEPRFDHDPITGQSLGLLIEESRTNLITYSEDFNSWTKFLASVSSNTATAPDGNTTADTVISNGGTTTGLVRQDVSGLADNTTYTFSVFLKTAGLNIITLQFYNKSNTFHGSKLLNLSTGALTGSDFVGTSSVVSYGNGWYRLIITNLGSGTGATTPNVRIVTSSIGNGTSGLYIWGAQVEAGAFPTSYIPTTASAVPRSVDNGVMSGNNLSSWYNQSEGTFFTSVKSSSGFTSGVNASSFGIFTSSNQIVLSNYNAASSIWFFRNSIGNNNAFFSQTMPVSSNRKSIATYRTGPPDYYTAAFAGSNIKDSTKTVTLRTDQSYLELNPNRSGLVPLNGTISRLTYYPIQLTNQQLINLTS